MQLGALLKTIRGTELVIEKLNPVIRGFTFVQAQVVEYGLTVTISCT